VNPVTVRRERRRVLLSNQKDSPAERVGSFAVTHLLEPHQEAIPVRPGGHDREKSLPVRSQ
jgi:hypothetical protein